MTYFLWQIRSHATDCIGLFYTPREVNTPCVQTQTCETSTFPQLHLRAVIIGCFPHLWGWRSTPVWEILDPPLQFTHKMVVDVLKVRTFIYGWITSAKSYVFIIIIYLVWIGEYSNGIRLPLIQQKIEIFWQGKKIPSHSANGNWVSFDWMNLIGWQSGFSWNVTVSMATYSSTLLMNKYHKNDIIYIQNI